MDWFDYTVPVDRLQSGLGVATPLELTDRYADDPIVGVRLGHPQADRGFEFLLRDILQAAMAPRDMDDWIHRLAAPPSPREFERLLAPYRPAFRIDHPETPAMQVRPTPACLAEAAGRKRSKSPGGRMGRDDGDDRDDRDDDKAAAQPIGTLLPDLPTAEALKQNADFFIHRRGVARIGAGAILPVLYAHMVLAPLRGGRGYLGLPHGPSSIKYQITGRTLWETIWLNVLWQGTVGTHQPHAAWPAPVDAAVFPWLDRDLRRMPLGSDVAGSARPLERSALHPAHIPMPRRYLLSPPQIGRCDLTGIAGPVFTHYSRWPKGLHYRQRGWWYPAVAGSGQDGDGDKAPGFAVTSEPLRFDDWLETALLGGVAKAGADGCADTTALPPILRQLRTVLDQRPEGLGTLGHRRHAATAVAPDSAIRVRTFALYRYGNALGGLSQRDLPIWVLPPGDLDWLRTEVSATLVIVERIRDALEGCSASAARIVRDKRPRSLALEVTQGFRAALDGSVLDLPAQLAGIVPVRPDGSARCDAADAARSSLLRRARDTAIGLFDGAFPIDGTGPADRQLARERGQLVRALNAALTQHSSPQGTA